MILEFFKALALAGVVSITAIVYKEILLREPVLHWWYKIGERWEGRWFFAPVWGCHKCIAGQWALWLYLFTRFNIEFSDKISAWGHYYTISVSIHAWGAYSLIWHIFAISASILFVTFLKYILDKQQ